MISRYEYSGGVWVDLERPSEDEVRQVLQEFSISERIGSELLYPTPAPLVAGDIGIALLVIHFPIPRTEDSESKSQEVDFIVGEHFIVTVRYEIVTPLHHLKKQLETELVLAAGGAALTTDVLLEILFAHLYTSVRDHITHVASQLTRVEEVMFTGTTRHTVRAISNISRDFLHLEATMVNHEEPLTRFLRTLSDRKFFGASFGERAARIGAQRVHIAHLIHTYRAVTTELRETNMALLETHQNQIMKTFTLITVIVLPLELIAVIFGMHAGGTPLEGHPDAFWIIMGGMAALVACMALYFSRKRWI
jgi:magnesium transporter